MHRAPRLIAKVAATVLLAVGIAAAGGTSAYADTSVTVLPGCYGASSTVYCDTTVDVLSAPTPQLVSTTIPVCAGTCRDVAAPWISLQSGSPGELRVCLRSKNRAGAESTTCSDGSGGGGGLVNSLKDLAEEYGQQVNELLYGQCDYYGNCSGGVVDKVTVAVQKALDTVQRYVNKVPPVSCATPVDFCNTISYY